MLMNTTFLGDSFFIKWQSRVLSHFTAFYNNSFTDLLTENRFGIYNIARSEKEDMER